MVSLKRSSTRFGLVGLFAYSVSFAQVMSSRRIASQEGPNTGGGSRGGAGDEKRKEVGTKEGGSKGNYCHAAPIPSGTRESSSTEPSKVIHA